LSHPQTCYNIYMSKYSKYVVTELKAPFSPEANARYNTFGKRILWMDKNVVPGAFQMSCAWYLKPLTKGPEPHVHDADEILGFFSSDPNNPYDLGGEIEFWLADEKFMITKSTMVFIPAGIKHCPIVIHRVDRPIIHFSVVTEGQWTMQKPKEQPGRESNYRNYLVTELNEPPEKKKIAKEYSKYARRILWMDRDVVDRAFHMNTAWYLKAAATLDDKPHTHKEDEIIGFIGGDPSNPTDLNGEVEIWLEDEKQIITKSAMLFIPAGMRHCPLVLKRVSRPIFHFTVVLSGRYVKDEKEG
jgi:mannose-6-phosphate isomerase-like protein (cupin superfamily)